MTQTIKKNSVLVTGISGFLGGHVALSFLNKGFHVRGSVRNLAKAEKVKQTLIRAGADISRLEFVALDLMSDAGWADAMQGMQFLAHTASPFVIDLPKNPDDLIRPAVEGTTRALKAALAANVERIVLTSSMVAIMYGHPKTRTEPFNAKDWTVAEGPHTNAYMLSKLHAERAAWRIMDDAGRHDDLSVINPSLIQGPLLDEDPGTSGAIVLRLMKGEIPALPRLKFPSIDVRDVAEAHVAALLSDAARGQRFPMSEAAPELFATTKIIGQALPAFASKMPKVMLPDWLTHFIGLFNKDIATAARELGKTGSVDSSAVIKLLGRPLLSAEQAYVEMAKSLLANGALKEPQ